MMQQNWWEAYPVVGAAHQAAPAPSRPVVVGTPRPKAPEIRQVGDSLGVVDPAGNFTPTYTKPPAPEKPEKPQFVPQGATQMMMPDGTIVPVPGAKPVDEKEALSNAISDLGVDELLGTLSRARNDLKSGWATGTWGALAELKPGGGTPRDDFKANLESLQGAIILEKLQALKELSKTGASGMGALSEKEGQRLAAAVAALNDRMSPEAYEQSFKTIERHANTLRAVRDGRDPNDPAVQREYGLIPIPAEQDDPTPPAPVVGYGSGGDGGGGGGDPAGGGRPDETYTNPLTAEQNRAYQAFWQANPQADARQLQAFLAGIGVEGVRNTEDIVAAVREGRGFAPEVETTYRGAVAQDANRTDENLGDDPLSTLAFQGGTLGLSDEAAGVGRAAANVITAPFTGRFDPVESYRLGRDSERERIDRAREALGWGGTAIEAVSGLGSMGPRVFGALAPLARDEGIRQATRSGAVGGALGGFGYGEGATESALGAMGGATVGATLGRYGQPVVERLTRRFSGGGGMAPELAAAAEAEDLDLIRPMVDPRSRALWGALESDPTAQPIIRAGAERVQGRIEDRATMLGGGGTSLGSEEAAGGRIQAAGNRFITRSRGVATTLYNRARNLAGNATVTPRASLTQLRQELSALSETPTVNQGEIDFLNELGEDLTRGPLSVEAIRGLRASVRGRINEKGLTASQADARAMRIIDALQQDAVDSLPPAAATAFRRADTYYRERMVHIDDVVSKIVGTRDNPLSGEKAFQRLKAMAAPGGDNRRLAAVMRNLDPNERQDVAATIAARLGRDAFDLPFSADKFITHTTGLSGPARRTLFGRDGAQSIDNLRQLAQSLKESGADINRSRSTSVANRMSPLRTAARTFVTSITGLGGYGLADTGGALAGVAVAAGVMGAGAVRKTLSAWALVNPRVSAWLARAANVNTPAQAEAVTRQLGSIISREPALAHELQPFYDMLSRSITAPALATEPGENNE